MATQQELFAAANKSRYTPSTILQRHKIPHLIWLEDALLHFGVPTGRFDLFLLVESPSDSIECLLANGYAISPPNHERYWTTPELRDDVTRLWPVEHHEEYLRTKKWPEDIIGVVLLPSRDWGDPTLTPELISEAGGYCFPTLQALYEGLVSRWLEAEPLSLGIRLQTHIAYIYHYIPAVKEAAFASLLRSFFQEFHLRYLEQSISLGEQGVWREKAKECYKVHES